MTTFGYEAFFTVSVGLCLQHISSVYLVPLISRRRAVLQALLVCDTAISASTHGSLRLI